MGNRVANRGGRQAILPLPVVLFTSTVLSTVLAISLFAARAAGAATPAAPGAAPPAGGDREAAADAPDKTPDTSAAEASDKGSVKVSGKTSAGASPAQAPAVAAVPPRLVPSLSHHLQLGLAVMPGGGYRIVFPYKTTVDCGDASNAMARVCTNRAPFFIDLQPSFGLSESWDFLVDLRLGVEQNVYRHHEVFIMPGFRYWLDPQSHVKFYITLQGALDVTPQSTTTVSGTDLGVRNSNGLMVEIMRNFGVYLQFGETVGFVRWLSFNVDAGVGVQARVP